MCSVLLLFCSGGTNIECKSNCKTAKSWIHERQVEHPMRIQHAAMGSAHSEEQASLLRNITQQSRRMAAPQRFPRTER
eukprot:1691719-Amphidinium_carterae.1